MLTGFLPLFCCSQAFQSVASGVAGAGAAEEATGRVRAQRSAAAPCMPGLRCQHALTTWAQQVILGN